MIPSKIPVKGKGEGAGFLTLTPKKNFNGESKVWLFTFVVDWKSMMVKACLDPLKPLVYK